MKALNPSVAHRAAETPDINEIYAPPSHADALDPDRVLVVGSRGVGKSFWAAVLADPKTRAAAAASYPKLDLNSFDVFLGFHEGSIASSSIAPTAPVLKQALKVCDDPAWIWRSVVLKALAPKEGPDRLTDRVQWLMDDPEEYSELISDVENRLLASKRRALIVFDALDVMANDWNTIRELTVGLARVALELVSSKTIRLKMFMRRDQFNDMRQKTFADFSKLRTAAVELDWSYKDLFGALFSRLWQDTGSSKALATLAQEAGIVGKSGGAVPLLLREDEAAQERLFALIAGEFMGVNAKRGRTYLWLPRHLADGHGETSLRSFLIALKEAAESTSDRNPLAVDRVSINQGVLKASQTRREEIKEDHPWVEDAIPPLEGLIVPCPDQELITRWHDANTVQKIRRRHDPERPAAPVQLSTLTDDGSPRAAEAALLQALEELGVIERRSEGRVNVPDIFRVTAKIKRKGGLAPRRRS
ncbi:hypothetical protein [Rhizorhabdus wittichii]|uniref:Uncharacterized protein n=1 Tax=Rhizorhabdus wittichii TaxID=160791 RepID=A0A975HBV4_9SPHN|nr:hypothetical protein [Rhizorhabdus wittichii]QTH19573.1 hypothetical protein HRJ34_14410 [Rhizorhabdus wittichii]